MAFNYFKGWDRKRLEAALTEAQEDLAAGKDTTAAGAGDAHVQSKVEMSPQSRIKMILRALNQVAPADYPSCDTVPITQTRVGFSTPSQLADPNRP